MTDLLRFPEIGSKWVSTDRRDDGLVVTVIAVGGNYIKIKRYNQTLVRRDRFYKAYRPLTENDNA